MRKLLAKAQTRVGAVVIGSAATLALGGVATAAVIDSPATDEVSDVSTVTTPAAETTEPEVDVTEPTVAVTTEAPVPVEQSAADAPAATVEDVTEPELTTPPAPPAAEGSQAYDPTAPFVQGGVTYVPGPADPPEPTPPTEPSVG